MHPILLGDIQPDTHLISPSERQIDEIDLANALLATTTAHEAPLDVTVPGATLVETGNNHLLMKEGVVDETSLAFNALHAVYMDNTYEKSLPLDPRYFALCIAQKAETPPDVPQKILGRLLEEEDPFSEDNFDIHKIAGSKANVTLVLPGRLNIEPATEHPLRVNDSAVRKLALLSLARTIPDSRKVGLIQKLLQPTPDITSESYGIKKEVLAPFYWSAHIDEAGLGNSYW